METEKKKKIAKWVTIAALITAVVAVSAYFLIDYLLNKDSSTVNEFDVIKIIDKSKNSITTLSGLLEAGTKVEINWNGTHKGKTIYSFSENQGKTFTKIGENTDQKTFEYTLPNNIFSTQCIFKIADDTDGTKELSSHQFDVVPVMTIDGPGKKQGDRIRVDSKVTFKVTSNQIDFLVTKGKLGVQYKSFSGGINWTDLGDIKSTTSSFVWTSVPASLLNLDLHFRIKTKTLKDNGYPYEINQHFPFSATVDATNGTTGISKGAFTFIGVHDANGAFPKIWSPGQNCRVTWGVTDNLIVPEVDIKWSDSVTGAFSVVKQNIQVSDGEYTFEILADMDGTTSMYLQVVSSSNPTVDYAISDPSEVLSRFSIIDSGVEKKFAMKIGEWTFTVPVEWDGLEATIPVASLWNTILHISSPTRKLLDLSSPIGKENFFLDIKLKDSTRKLYDFVYTALSPLPLDKKTTDGSAPVTFKVELIRTDIGLFSDGANKMISSQNFIAEAIQ